VYGSRSGLGAQQKAKLQARHTTAGGGEPGEEAADGVLSHTAAVRRAEADRASTAGGPEDPPEFQLDGAAVGRGPDGASRATTEIGSQPRTRQNTFDLP